MQYTARFTNRDGSIDIHQLGELESDALAMSKARTALFVSLAAVCVDVTSNAFEWATFAGKFPAPRSLTRQGGSSEAWLR